MKRNDYYTQLHHFFDIYWWNNKYKSRLIKYMWEFQEPCTRYAMQYVGNIAGKRVLEIGPGEGKDTLLFIKKGAAVTTVDISYKSLMLTQNLVHRELPTGTINLSKMRAEQLAFRSQSFDLIYARTVLMHLDYHKFFQECNRLLTTTGKTVFIEPLKYHPLILLYRVLVSPGRFSNPNYITLHTINELSKYFEYIQHKEFFLFSVLLLPLKKLGNDSKKFKKLLDFVFKCDCWLIDRISWIRKLCWITVICCKK